jgi:hypothetical protein
VPGAGDDEESWSHGLTPAVFWGEPAHSHLLEARGADCVQLVHELMGDKAHAVRARAQLTRPPSGASPSPGVCVS